MRLGEMLIERKQITQEDLDRALELQKERGDKLGKILVDMGFIAQRDVLAALSDQLGMPLVTIDGPPPAAPEIEGLSPRFLRQCRCLPVALDDSHAHLAMADPLDFETIAAVRASPGCRSHRRSRPSRKSSTPSTAITARRQREPTPTAVDEAAMREISNTCATWRAKRRSSGWSTP